CDLPTSTPATPTVTEPERLVSFLWEVSVLTSRFPFSLRVTLVDFSRLSVESAPTLPPPAFTFTLPPLVFFSVTVIESPLFFTESAVGWPAPFHRCRAASQP